MKGETSEKRAGYQINYKEKNIFDQFALVCFAFQTKAQTETKFMKIFKLIFLLSIFILPGHTIFAQLEGNSENFCRNGFFPRESETYSIGKIKAKKGERVYFYGDDNDCPNGKNCRLKSYLIPNDKVIVSRNFAGFACAWFQPAKGAETVGWIPLDKLELDETDKNFDKKTLTGTWTYYDSEIKIAATGKPDIYKITGDALWKGIGDNVHIGELDGEAKLVGINLKYGEDDEDEFACKVTMRLVDNFLIVSDNLNCGGVNVSFSGVYRKK